MAGKLDRLEEQGLIQRVPDPTDRRAVKLRITDSDRSLIGEAFSTSLKVYESMLNELSRTDTRLRPETDAISMVKVVTSSWSGLSDL